MGRIFFGIAAIFFFLAAVNANNIIPNPTAWGLVLMALGLTIGGWIPWRKGTA